MKKSKYSIVRTYSAGVFFAIIKSRKGQEAVIDKARRVWYWSGAASLSQMAVEGVKNPGQCKIAMPVDGVVLTQVIEILPCSVEAERNLSGVPIWKQ